MDKFLNLVFDEYDEHSGNIIPNISKEYPTKNIGNPHHLIMHFTDDTSYNNKFIQRLCTYNDVYNTPNENFYYFISHGSESIYDLFHPNENETKIPLNENVINTLKNYKNFYVVFLSEHEPDVEKSFEKLNNFLNENNINGEQIFVINNNYKLIDYKEKYKSKINVHTLRFIPHSFTKVLTKIGGCEFNPNKEGKFFMCFNKSPKRQRFALLCFLKKYDLLKDINWSYVPTWDSKPNSSYYKEIFDENDINFFQKEIDFFHDLKIKRSDYEEEKNWFNAFSEINRDDFPIWLHVPEYPKNYESSYVNIVTESMFLDINNNIHISEKTFKPFFYYQFPLILSTHNHIKMVKEKYGLDFFDDIIDHSYDSESNQRIRLEMFVNEIKRLNENQEQLRDFYSKNRDRFEQNKMKVIEILKIVDEDYKFFESLIK